MGPAQDLWTNCQESLRTQVSDAVWRSTFQDIAALDLDGTSLSLAVPSGVVKERLSGRYLSLVEDIVRDVSGQDLSIELAIRTDALDDDPVIDPLDDLLSAAPAVGEAPSDRLPSGDNEPRNLTFDDFVTGTSNRFAHAAALAVAETPGRSYNPLFIYGDAGLGKTHLLQAIRCYVEENYPDYVVRYVTSETFLNQFIESIRLNTSAEFKRRYREVDVLLVDDIQFLENRKETQEEFFHTFNALHEGRRQLVLSSDRPPDAISTLENRLRSRFKMGLITDIQPPAFETRLAILQKKNEQAATSVPADVLSYIAEHITYNIRELEGALIRVGAYAALNQTELTVDLAAEILADTIKSTKPRQITPELILTQTAEYFKMDVEQLQSRSRTRNLVHARQIAMYVCRELTDLSYPQIGREFGGRDHTTVIHAYEKVAALMQEKHETYEDVTALIQSLLAER